MGLVCVLAPPTGGALQDRHAEERAGRVRHLLEQACLNPDDALSVLTVDHEDPALAAALGDVPVRAVARDAVMRTLGELAQGHDRVAVISDDVVAHDRVVRTVLRAPGSGARVLIGPSAAAARAGSLVVEDGYVVAVDESGRAQALGVLRLPADAARSAADLAESTVEPVPADPFAMVIAALVGRGVDVGVVDRRGFVAERPRTPQARAEAVARLASVDEDRAAMDAAVKAHDGFFTTFFVSPYSRHVARWAARRGLSPNQVTTFSMVLGLVAAACFAAGTLPWRIAGAVSLQLAFMLDCVDGQLARYALRFSPFGAWLDSMFDRGKEYAVYVGLALGAVRAGDDGIWLLVALALALQTLRHHLDLAYNAQAAEAAAARRRAGPPPPGRTSGQPAPGGLIGVAHGMNRVAALKWAKQILILPIGERFLLISVGAVVVGARGTLVALLVWGAVAGLYTATGRLLRSRA